MFPFDMYIFNKKVREKSVEVTARGWNNNQLVLLTFRYNLFDLNHVKTFASSTFIVSNIVSILLWNRNKSYHKQTLVPLQALMLLHRLGKEVVRV